LVQAAAAPACVKLVSERPDAAESSIEDDAPQVWEPGAIRRGGVRRRCVERSSLITRGREPRSRIDQVRHRAEAVEYRVERHAAKLGARSLDTPP